MAELKQHRILSLLPSATEIVDIAGAGHLLVGRSHECDWPPQFQHLPVLTAAINGQFTTSREVHEVTCKAMEAGTGLYSIDAELLVQLQPTVIVTQDVCEVCSVDLVTVERVVHRSNLNPKPEIISLNPQSLDDVVNDILRVGKAVGTEVQAEAAVQKLQQRVQAALKLVKELGTSKLSKCCFLEWTDPLFNAGHWTPAMIEMAGGSHPLNPLLPGKAAAGPSFVVTPEAVAEMDPDIIIIAPCGLDLQAARVEATAMTKNAWWSKLRAVQEGNVLLVDGNAHFNRPGPRLVEALEFLIAVLHQRWELIPQGFAWDLFKVLPDEPPASSTSTAQLAASNGHVAGGAAAERLCEEVVADVDEGWHSAPCLPADVEECYLGAKAAGKSQYRDPISGYQCFTETALRSRATCCGNRCRHCPYGHFRVVHARKGPRLNRITAPAHLAWANYCGPKPTSTILLAVAAGQAELAAARLEQLRAAASEGTSITVLVAVDTRSRSMWSVPSDAHGATDATQPTAISIQSDATQPTATSIQSGPRCKEGAASADDGALSAVMDWCLAAKVSCVAVPVSNKLASTAGSALQLAAEILRVAQKVLSSMEVNQVAWVGTDAVPQWHWLGSQHQHQLSWQDIAQQAGMATL